MAKRHQQRPAEERQGRNYPEKSTVHAASARVEHPEVTTNKQDSQLRMREGEQRSGSDSNAHSPRKGSRLHRSAQREPQAHPQQSDDFTEDLRSDNLAGANMGLSSQVAQQGVPARDIKALYGTLADLTNNELDTLLLVPLGERLEQGAKYIDLRHLEQGEFVAMAGMLSDEDHYYVAKKQTDYVLWNRLNQVDNPARLDEADRERG